MAKIARLEAAGIDSVSCGATDGGPAMRPGLWPGNGVEGPWVPLPRMSKRAARESSTCRRSRSRRWPGAAAVTDFDPHRRTAYDTRYRNLSLRRPSAEDAAQTFSARSPGRSLEVGCGYRALAGRRQRDSARQRGSALKLSPCTDDRRRERLLAERFVLAGVDPSAAMLARPRREKSPSAASRPVAAPSPFPLARRLLRSTLTAFNSPPSLHRSPPRSSPRARRVPSSRAAALLTIGKDPHTDHDDWWVYQ